LDPAYLSARKEKPELHVPVPAVVDRVEECLLNVFLVLGVNLSKRIAPHEILLVSEQAPVGGIRVNPPALRVDQDDQVGGTLRDQTETLFGLAKVLRHLRGELEGAAARGGQGMEDSRQQQSSKQSRD